MNDDCSMKYTCNGLMDINGIKTACKAPGSKCGIVKGKRGCYCGDMDCSGKYLIPHSHLTDTHLLIHT